MHTTESAGHAAALGTATCATAGFDATKLVLHSDNGGPMKSATMVVTLECLEGLPSFVRREQRHSPLRSALSHAQVRRDVFNGAVCRYRCGIGVDRTLCAVVLPRAIRFVTPEDRHTCRDVAHLAARGAAPALHRRTRTRQHAEVARRGTGPPSRSSGSIRSTTTPRNHRRSRRTAPYENCFYAHRVTS